jgi:prephenate dehydrogenase
VAFGKICVVGVGLIGASIVQAVARAWPRVDVVTVEAGEGVEKAAGADLVVLAAPVLANVTRLTELPRYLGPRTIVTDVGSTKRLIVAAAHAIPSLIFVGGHPIAGSAAGGASNARPDLFDGRPWILTPSPADAGAVQQVEAFVTALGAVPHVMTAELHDRFIGAVSHLPQLASSALMHTVGALAGDAGLELAGNGLLDSTRLAESPPDIWKDITATNHDVLREALDRLIGTLTELRDTLESGDAIDSVFTSAARWRAELRRGRS